uniref:CoA transferase n=1 Tax=Phenylobacterium glaciei TaxID=2803784 RepID=A0A974P0Q1_9CAUL|nr:CoA transferase [Phenylobacterium glaciei]
MTYDLIRPSPGRAVEHVRSAEGPAGGGGLGLRGGADLRAVPGPDGRAGDPLRQYRRRARFPPLAALRGGDSLYWEGLNKGKLSVALDLARPEGRELAQRLAAAPGDDGGLFVTNFPVDGFLSYEKLSALRSDLICVRVMGWADGSQGMDYTINSALGLPLMTGPVGTSGP